MARQGDRTVAAPCSVSECDRGALAKGLCRMHYARQYAGRPLVDPSPAVGSRSGFGEYGVLDDDGDTVLCHECGERYVGLAAHVVMAHGMAARSYKLAHGLKLTGSLIPASVRAQQSERSKARVGGAAWKRMEAVRDPIAASLARDPDAVVRGGKLRDPELAITNGRKARRVKVIACVQCGATWCPLPGGGNRKVCSGECQDRWASARQGRPQNPDRDAQIVLQVLKMGRDRGEVGAEFGIGRERVGQIVRRHERTRSTVGGPAAPETPGAPASQG